MPLGSRPRESRLARWGRLLRREFLRRPARYVGAAVGLALGILVLWIGLWAALFLAAMTAGGFYVGRRAEGDGRDPREWIERFLPRRNL